MESATESAIERAAAIIGGADAIIVAAGAGMGVDSGLPDFRGTTGFWRAYPLYEKLGLDFASTANPRWFHTDPAFAWGFYGHRLELYRKTVPHHGFSILKRWSASRRHGGFVFTSNVDGQFQKAGFDGEHVVEIHGSIHFMQCTGDCPGGVAPADPYTIELDPETLRARDPLPRCARCERVLRPNILMFGDGAWDSRRSEAQEERFGAWIEAIGGARIAVVECGAGTAIPSVRRFSEAIHRRRGATLIRINVREAASPAGAIELEMGALAAIRAIDERLSASPKAS